MLRATSTEEFVVNEQVLAAPKVELTLRLWTGLSLMNEFGASPCWILVAGRCSSVDFSLLNPDRFNL